MHRRDQLGIIEDRAVGRRILQQRAEAGGVGIELGRVAHDHVDALRHRARADDVDRLRMAVARDEKLVRRVAAAHRVQQGHRLGRGGRLVQQRGIRDVEPGQVGHHGLEIEQRLQPPLRDLRLVRRVRRVPAGIFQDVALDHRRRDRVVVALAEVRLEDLVLVHDGAQGRERLALAQRRGQLQRAPKPDRRRDHVRGQRIERIVAERGQHLRHLIRPGPEMPPRKRVERGEKIRCGRQRRDSLVIRTGRGKPVKSRRLPGLVHSSW